MRTVAQPSTTRKSQERATPSSHRHPQSNIKQRAAKAWVASPLSFNLRLGRAVLFVRTASCAFSVRCLGDNFHILLLHGHDRDASYLVRPPFPTAQFRDLDLSRDSEESQTQSTGLRKEKVQSWTHSDRPDVPPLVHPRKQPILLCKHHRRPERSIQRRVAKPPVEVVQRCPTSESLSEVDDRVGAVVRPVRSVAAAPVERREDPVEWFAEPFERGEVHSEGATSFG